MFAFKKNYFLILENTKDIDLNNVKLYKNLTLFIEITEKKKNWQK